MLQWKSKPVDSHFKSVREDALENHEIDDDDDDEFNDLLYVLRNDLKILKEEESRILAHIDKTISSVEKAAGF